MKSIKFKGLIVVTITILLAACGKKVPSYTKYIPKDATYVISLDVKGMMAKLEKDSLSVEDMLTVLKDSSDPAKYNEAVQHWKQFKDAGIGFDEKVLVAVPAVSMNGGSVSIEVLADLKDEKKLEAFITKNPDAKITKEGGISYASIEGWLVGWNDDAVMLLGSHATPNMPQMSGDDSSGATYAPAPKPGVSAGDVETMKKYFALKKDESLASVDSYTDVADEKADIAIYTNSGGLASAKAGMGMAMMPKVKELLDGIYSTSTINFEDGKAVMKGNTYVGPKLAEVLKKYAGPTVDWDLVSRYPGKNVDGVVAFSFNPEIIPALLKETGFDALADMTLQQQGITVADITKAFKGDFAVVFSDFSITQQMKANLDGEMHKNMKPDAKLLIALRIGDKAAFDKLLGLATKTGLFIRQGNRLIPASGGAPDTANVMQIGIENDLVVISNDAATYQGYVAKTGKIELPDGAESMIKGSSIAFFMDAQNLLGGLSNELFDSTSVHEQNVLNNAKAVFKYGGFTTSNFDGKKISGTGELTMMNNKNSLPQLVRFMMATANEMKMKDAEKEIKMVNMPMPDSTDTDGE